MKKFLIIIVICLGAYATLYYYPGNLTISSIKSLVPFLNHELSTSDTALKNAFDNKISNFQVGGSGKVIKVLPDDNEGRRHQRFIIKLSSGQTLLIAHNIDLAPRVGNLKAGDHVNFYGVYEWNSKGGVVHWTHHDPNGQHEGGWLNHGGKLYQ